MMRMSLLAERRPATNRTGLKRLRREGRLPGVIFGVEREQAMVHVSAKDFAKFLKSGESGVIELRVEGQGDIPVLLESLQRDPVSKEPIHVDFLKVQADKIVRTFVTVEFTGTPAGTKIGGVVQSQRASIEVRALPNEVPSSIVVDISHLEIGGTLKSGDLELPKGVELVSSDNELLVSVTK